MKKPVIYFISILLIFQGFSQKIETDIFGNLVYKSKYREYVAYLKEKAFDNLIFTDCNDNEIILNKKYIALEYPQIIKNEEEKIIFFKDLINKFKLHEGYEATYDADIFGHITITEKDNKKIEIRRDFFDSRRAIIDKRKTPKTIYRNFFGELEYKKNRLKANLDQNVFDNWIYKDSHNNKLEFSEKAWCSLKQKFGSDEKVFLFLIENFLLL